jgi:hypothetical protein
MATGPDDGKFKPGFPGDRATAPTPLEDGSDAVWEEFERLQSGLAPIDARAPGPEQPASREPRALTRVVLEDTMLLARRANRSSPKPLHWRRMYELLPARASARPPQGFSEKDAPRASPMQKRLLLRDHIEWAAAMGCLPAVHGFLDALAEDDWEHF